MNAAEQKHLLDRLQFLLEKQIELAKGGDISGVESLSRQADVIVRKIARTEVLEQPEFRNRRKKLQKLYGDLSLAVSAQKAEACEQLGRVRKGRKIIETYRSNV